MVKKDASSGDWYRVENPSELSSPSLMVYPDRIEVNIRKMIEIAGTPDRLRPHVKTHKMPEIVRLQMKHDIYKFKCATISEAEMVARCGAEDVLLAIQPVGPNQDRFFRLKQQFPDTKISCIVDSEEVILQLSSMALKTGIETPVWLDINNGMNRTGITPGMEACRLYKLINRFPMIKAEGLHVYDGHIHDADYSVREKTCNDSFAQVTEFIKNLKDEGILVPKIIAGGTPSFPIHALRSEVECSPGTLLLWDYKSSSSYTDMDFLHAAVLATRIISKPGNDLICIDLGHKAVASEMPQPRISIFGLGRYTVLNHSEEHMVIKTVQADRYKTGDLLYGIPWHICPTVDRYDFVFTVSEKMVTGQWDVEARRRKITI